ncbi:MAG: hypothetical protein V4501_08170 [Pseudomonadota bacterium]
MNTTQQDPFVFSSQPPFYVRVGEAYQSIDLGDVPRTYDFSRELVSSITGCNNIATLITGAPNSKYAVFSASRIRPEGIKGRIEFTEQGLKIANMPGDGCPSEPLRATIASFALPADQRLFWNLRVQFGDAPENWLLTPSGVDPALVWQIKAPGLQPSLAMVVDTDDKDPAKLMLFFNIKVNDQIERVGTVRGLIPYQPINVLMEGLLDEQDSDKGGRGFWRVKVNGKLAVDYLGPTLVKTAEAPHQWFIGLYRYLTFGPAFIPRTSYWSRAQLLGF